MGPGAIGVGKGILYIEGSAKLKGGNIWMGNPRAPHPLYEVLCTMISFDTITSVPLVSLLLPSDHTCRN